MFTMVDARKPYRPPFACPVCGREHAFKTYHIRLDDTGAAIVSKEIWQRLRTIPDSGFESVDTVKKPPAQGVAIARQRVTFATGDMEEAPGGVIVRHPSLTAQRLVAIDDQTPYPQPYDCPICGSQHRHKTYHLDLDAEGAALVSPQIAAVLERLGMTRDPAPEPVRLVSGD